MFKTALESADLPNIGKEGPAWRNAYAKLSHAHAVAHFNIEPPPTPALAVAGTPAALRGLTDAELEADLPEHENRALEDAHRLRHPDWPTQPKYTAGPALVNRTHRQWKAGAAEAPNLQKVRSYGNANSAPLRKGDPPRYGHIHFADHDPGCNH